MPNLTSTKRLVDLYEDDCNSFMILFAEYTSYAEEIVFDSVRFFPIEHLKWDCLALGALGWGQLQITNANDVNIDRDQSRKDWMLSLCDALDIFYPKEIDKINARIEYFSKIRTFWEQK